MAEFYVRNEIGGTVILKVQAETEERALHLAAAATIDDWEEAGSLKFGDVRQQLIDPTDAFDGSIYQNDEGYYATAKDDPQYDPELDGDDE